MQPATWKSAVATMLHIDPIGRANLRASYSQRPRDESHQIAPSLHRAAHVAGVGAPSGQQQPRNSRTSAGVRQPPCPLQERLAGHDSVPFGKPWSIGLCPGYAHGVLFVHHERASRGLLAGEPGVKARDGSASTNSLQCCYQT
ncbi:hypothetical protein S40288_11094 [Stachybotrys chartarum IBT 40288]|nr:hypothetical protein S40288_11094 [Stachybotrys chartarum IBT 40288]